MLLLCFSAPPYDPPSATEQRAAAVCLVGKVRVPSGGRALPGFLTPPPPLYFTAPPLCLQPDQREVAVRLVEEVWVPSGGAAWVGAQLQGLKLNLKASHGWPANMPKEGTLKVRRSREGPCIGSIAVDGQVRAPGLKHIGQF